MYSCSRPQFEDFEDNLLNLTREPEVISTPRIPPPMDPEADEFDQFIRSLGPASPPTLHLQQMSMEQPPEQPAIDSMEVSAVQQQPEPVFYDTKTTGLVYYQQQPVDVTKQVIKQEKMSGFLDTWAQQPACEDSMSVATSPDEQKRTESSLIKEELSCRIQLKMIKEGKDYSAEADANPAVSVDCQVSQETLLLQRVRREKNREAAKKCRQKKKKNEKLLEEQLRQSEREIEALRKQLNEERREYGSLLNGFKTFPCFMAYLKQNREALKSPYLKAALQTYTRDQQRSGNVGEVKSCCANHCSGGGGVGGGVGVGVGGGGDVGGGLFDPAVSSIEQ